MKHISPFLRLQKFPSGSRRILPPDAALCQAARPAHDLIYRVLVLGLVGCALTGCGGGAKTIDTPTLVRVLGGAGFRNLYVISNEAQLQKLARTFAYDSTAEVRSGVTPERSRRQRLRSQGECGTKARPAPCVAVCRSFQRAGARDRQSATGSDIREPASALAGSYSSWRRHHR